MKTMDVDLRTRWANAWRRASTLALALLLALPMLPLASLANPRPGVRADSTAPISAEPGPQTEATTGSLEKSVVKVFSTARYADPFRPWTKQPPAEVSGSGVVIEGKRILTNAHVVLYASQVQIQANQGGDKLTAKVVAIAPGIDLALLQLEDQEFFDSHPPMKRATVMPGIGDAVLAYGFPTGGSSLSITKGIVSRIEFVHYNLAAAALRVQIDAAINPGNSGGPAVGGDKMIGIAFSRLGSADNIGYIIPNEEIELFLKSIAGDRYAGKPGIYDVFQSLENPALRTFLKLGDSVRGVIVNEPFSSDTAYPLRKWDVVTEIAGTPIDDQGMISLAGNIRVNFEYLVQKAASNGSVPLSLVRSGTVLHVQLPVSTDRPRLIPELAGDYPPYFIYGPLVFSKATTAMVGSLAKNYEAVAGAMTISNPLVTRFGEAPGPDLEELVVVASPMFPHHLAKGYDNHFGAVVESVNGTRVRSLLHLVALLRDQRDEMVVFDFAGHATEPLVFRRTDIAPATEEILNDNGIRAAGSGDVMQVWQAR